MTDRRPRCSANVLRHRYRYDFDSEDGLTRRCRLPAVEGHDTCQFHSEGAMEAIRKKKHERTLARMEARAQAASHRRKMLVEDSPEYRKLKALVQTYKEGVQELASRVEHYKALAATMGAPAEAFFEEDRDCLTVPPSVSILIGMVAHAENPQGGTLF